MYESAAPLFDDLPDAATHVQLPDALQAQCQTPEMTAEIARFRDIFLKMGNPEKKLFEVIRKSVRHHGTAPDGTRLVTVFETLYDLNRNGTSGAHRPAEPAVLLRDAESCFIRG